MFTLIRWLWYAFVLVIGGMIILAMLPFFLLLFAVAALPLILVIFLL